MTSSCVCMKFRWVIRAGYAHWIIKGGRKDARDMAAMKKKGLVKNVKAQFKEVYTTQLISHQWFRRFLMYCNEESDSKLQACMHHCVTCSRGQPFAERIISVMLYIFVSL